MENLTSGRSVCRLITRPPRSGRQKAPYKWKKKRGQNFTKGAPDLDCSIFYEMEWAFFNELMCKKNLGEVFSKLRPNVQLIEKKNGFGEDD